MQVFMQQLLLYGEVLDIRQASFSLTSRPPNTFNLSVLLDLILPKSCFDFCTRQALLRSKRKGHLVLARVGPHASARLA